MKEILKRYRRVVHDFPGASTYVEYVPRDDIEEVLETSPPSRVTFMRMLSSLAIQILAMVGVLIR